jgi:hypothetical protein
MEGTTNNIFQTTFSSDNNTTDNFIVEDLLNLNNDVDDDATIISDTNLDSATINSTASSSTVTVVNSVSSSSLSACDPNVVPDIGCQNFSDSHFSGDLCVPVYYMCICIINYYLFLKNIYKARRHFTFS